MSNVSQKEGDFRFVRLTSLESITCVIGEGVFRKSEEGVSLRLDWGLITSWRRTRAKTDDGLGKFETGEDGTVIAKGTRSSAPVICSFGGIEDGERSNLSKAWRLSSDWSKEVISEITQISVKIFTIEIAPLSKFFFAL